MSEVAKPNRKVLNHELNDTEFNQRQFVMRPERGTTLDEMLNPMYWANVAQRMTVGDTVLVRNESSQNIALLDVDVVQPFAVKVSIRWQREVERAQAEQSVTDIPAGYELKWRGPQNKFCILREADKEIVVSGAESKALAAARLREQLRLLAA